MDLLRLVLIEEAPAIGHANLCSDGQSEVTRRLSIHENALPCPSWEGFYKFFLELIKFHMANAAHSQ